MPESADESHPDPLAAIGLDGRDLIRLGRALVARHISRADPLSSDGFDDAAQDFAIGAIEAAQRADPERRTASTYVIAAGIWGARRAVNRSRCRRRRDGLSLDAPLADGDLDPLVAAIADPNAADPADVIEAADLRDAARRAIADALRKLRRRHRVPIVRVYLQGQSVVAVAGELGISRQTLHKRLRRGLAQLRAAVEAASPELAALFRQQGRAAKPS